MSSLGCRELVEFGNAPSEECIRAAAPHVAHDVELLKLAWASRDTRIGWTLWFVIARGLMDFLFRNSRVKGKDDILAADFVDWQNTSKELLAERPADYDSCRDAANKYSAHLTYSRIDSAGGTSTPSEAVHNFLLGVVAVWLNALPPTRRVWLGGL